MKVRSEREWTHTLLDPSLKQLPPLYMPSYSPTNCHMLRYKIQYNLSLYGCHVYNSNDS